MEILMKANRNQQPYDNHDLSRVYINYPHKMQLQSYVAAKNYGKQFRRCNSCSDIENKTKIDICMGTRVSRSHSSDSVVINNASVVYEPLNRINVLVNQDTVSDVNDSDDYKLLDSSSNDESDDNEFSNVKLNMPNNDTDDDDDGFHECPIKDSNDTNDEPIEDHDDCGGYKYSSDVENTTAYLNVNKTTTNCDGQQYVSNNNTTDENSCSIITKSTNGHTLQSNVNVAAPRTDNYCAATVIKKFSTLPRMKAHESIVRNENCVRRSCKFRETKISREREIEEVKKPVKLENIHNCDSSSSNTILMNIQENNNNKRDSAVIMETQKSDKINDLLFHCTTLPKARSRMSELPHFRHSLRRSIDLDRPRECLSECIAAGNGTATVVSRDESTSGTGMSYNFI